MRERRIELHIEELMLEGFAPRDRQGIGAALEAELTRLLAEGGAAEAIQEAGGSLRLDAGTFRVAAGATPQQIGAQVAQAVYSGLKR